MTVGRINKSTIGLLALVAALFNWGYSEAAALDAVKPEGVRAPLPGADASNPLTTIPSVSDVVANKDGVDVKAKYEMAKQIQSITVTLQPAESPLRSYFAVQCTITNDSKIPIVVNGDKATLSSPKDTADAASQNKLDSVGRPPKGMSLVRSDVFSVVTAAVSVGAVQTIRGFEMEKKPVLKRYEWDEERRANEEKRFGSRLLYPGDSTTGNFYFPLSARHEGILNCPVTDFYDDKNVGVLRAALN